MDFLEGKYQNTPANEYEESVLVNPDVAKWVNAVPYANVYFNSPITDDLGTINIYYSGILSNDGVITTGSWDTLAPSAATGTFTTVATDLVACEAIRVA